MHKFPKYMNVHTRTTLQRESALAFCQNRESDAIFFSTEALCSGIHRKFDDECRKLTPCDNVLSSLVKELKLQVEREPTGPDPTTGFADLHLCCQQLPEEWTVFQINKCYTPRWNSLTHQQMLEERTCVELILLKYPNSELLGGEPILIRLDPPDEADFFSVMSSIPVEVKSFLEEEVNSGSRRQDEIESHIGGIIDRLVGWLGPWIVLFSGKFISHRDQQFEAEIFNRVEDYCIMNKWSKRDQLLMSLLARRLDLVDLKTIYRFCCDMVVDEHQLKGLFEFLAGLKETKFDVMFSANCFPCLLIVDELVDSYPWEMINASQEFCRLGSLRLLKQLYEANKNKIKNGYLRVPVSNCHSIINPDNNLTKMSTRLQAFYKEWYQDFELIIDTPPTDSEFNNILREADVMIYNGHGTGLQFIDGETILQQDIKSLIFLFGCDSVRLFANGLFRDMAGSHLYYNIAKCPTVVGALWALTDYFTDYYSILLIGQWIPTRNPKFREHSVFDLDSSAFKHGKLVTKKTQSKLGDENLLALMAQFRKRNWLPKRIRCAMVCRGLPVVNSSY
ncbi:uncharacterized protein LOC134226005 isoform X2 [Armigeres subalbatus]|uniref:uncharacterized protein LOC134226005 isoform X2 n=1 Tax=Armigeres subalbatus TaxID=124917 RepID=UPI002ED37421